MTISMAGAVRARASVRKTVTRRRRPPNARVGFGIKQVQIHNLSESYVFPRVLKCMMKKTMRILPTQQST
jgi:hypothetical protein